MSFNWRLLLAPEPVLDYVVWHEVCHLEVMDHSPRFWALLERRCPDYREHAALAAPARRDAGPLAPARRRGQSPVGTTPADSTIRIAVRTGARVRCSTPLRDGVALMGLERDRVAILEIDQQPSLEHQEELVLVIVVMPVKVTLDHPESDHRRR